MNHATWSVIFAFKLSLLSQTPNDRCFVDPFNGKKYPNLQLYTPDGNKKPEDKNGVVYLLTDQDLIDTRTTVEAMVSYIKSAEAKVREITKSIKSEFMLLARFDINKKSHNIKIFTSRAVDNFILQAIQTALESIKPPTVSDQVLFCVQYSIGS